MNSLVPRGRAAVMTSREIAELVETSHDSVLKTVRALIERGVVSGNETPYTHPQNQQTYTEFQLDYRNTMVVVSGYSVELRARIIDRWQALEATTAGSVLSAETARPKYGVAAPVAVEFKALLTIAKLSGLKGNQATLAASQGTERLTGTNPLALIGQTHLIAPDQVRHYTPTELGKELGESAQAFNKRLESAGYQIKNIHGEWQAVGAGERHAVLLDTGKKHSNGTPIQQLRWLHTVLDAITNPEAA